MKIGDIVECVNTTKFKTLYTAIKPLRRNFQYTVRGFASYKGAVLVYLDEVVNRPCSQGQEMAYAITLLRVIEFPPALTESIQECLTRELEVVK